MMTLAPIYCTSCFWRCHKFNYLTSTSLELVPMSVGNISVWTVHHVSSMQLLHMAFLQQENPPRDIRHG
jgi:hypothetical protein